MSAVATCVRWPKGAHLAGERRRTKYGNRRTSSLNRVFDSKLEADRAKDLALLQQAGKIAELEFQVRVCLGGLWWRADFRYRDQGQVFYEDTKGVVDQRFRDVCALWPMHGPAPLRITRRFRRGIAIARVIVPLDPEARAAALNGVVEP